MNNRDDQTLVILSDTHVGDRVRVLDPRLIDAIQKIQPKYILHAGDISKPIVIEQLKSIAPVIAVQGNRDWLRGYRLPRSVQLIINGVRITLTHGHIDMFQYVHNYLRLFITNHKQSTHHFQSLLSRLYPDSDVIIYGHTHYQIDEVFNNQHFINPGAAYAHILNHYQIQYCYVKITSGGEVLVQKLRLPPSPQNQKLV